MEILSPKETAEALAKIQEEVAGEPLDSELVADAPAKTDDIIETEDELEQFDANDEQLLPDDDEDYGKDN